MQEIHIHFKLINESNNSYIFKDAETGLEVKVYASLMQKTAVLRAKLIMKHNITINKDNQ